MSANSVFKNTLNVFIIFLVRQELSYNFEKGVSTIVSSLKKKKKRTARIWVKGIKKIKGLIDSWTRQVLIIQQDFMGKLIDSV